ncbi:MAG: glycosyltransferase [Litoreibacter sp.]
MATLNLTVAVAVLGDALLNLKCDDFPPNEHVRYDIFVQNAGADHEAHANEFLKRNDIRVFFLATLGVANSRNAALERADSDVLLFADDDLTLLTENYGQLLSFFNKNESVDFVCCRLFDGAGQPFKKYARNGCRAKRSNCGRVGTPEMAVRPTSFRKSGTCFDPMFGAGAALYSGDEYIFLCDALKAGHKGRHLDLFLAIHDGESTGHAHKADGFYVKDKVLRRALRPWSWPYRCAFAIKHRKKFAGWKDMLKFVSP